MFIRSRSLIFFFSVVFVFFCFLCPVFGSTDNQTGDSTSDDRDLVTLATEIARQGGIDVDSCYARVSIEDDFVTVIFMPKNKNQVGGGGKAYFTKEQGPFFKFVKMELWQ